VWYNTNAGQGDQLTFTIYNPQFNSTASVQVNASPTGTGSVTTSAGRYDVTFRRPYSGGR
jgi:hypothetical protein